jgi:multimeric flavodoxin WrbA
MILGISASRRIWGNCDTAVKSVLSAAMESQAQTEFVRLTEVPIEPCRGCFRCLKEDRRCAIEDGLDRLLDRIRSARGLVLAAPVYFMAPPAVLISLLDRLLIMSGSGGSPDGSRPAAAFTIMGNMRWRGVAQPLVNLTVSLLGFEIAESLSLVAEGPGQVLASKEVGRRLEEIGVALATGRPITRTEGPGSCPVCGSSFFEVQAPLLVCPVCGAAGDLETYVRERRFVRTGGELRWGLDWLDRHVDSWVRPSVDRYLRDRRSILRQLRDLKERYSLAAERGESNV